MTVASLQLAPAPRPVVTENRSVRRFTLDGDDELEARLEEICAEALTGVRKIVPGNRLEALLLGGGYGRGEGGVLKASTVDQPYNDLEFYVAIEGNRFFNRRRFGKHLLKLAKSLESRVNIDVEFHIFSLAELRRSEPSMFYYDLVMGHRRLCGAENIFEGCQRHREARQIPLAEGTRLLMNRGTGLLLAREKLERGAREPEAKDFIARNIAKAQLALGDAVLTAFGQYHWSCGERHRRLVSFPELRDLPVLDEVREHHAVGLQFKLHPQRSRDSLNALRDAHQRVVQLLRFVWLWVESRRLGTTFDSAHDYITSPVDKCPETNPRRNRLLNLRLFGPAEFFGPNGVHHPRERILNALACLLWEKSSSDQRVIKILSGGRALARTEVLELYQEIWARVR